MRTHPGLRRTREICVGAFLAALMAACGGDGVVGAPDAGPSLTAPPALDDGWSVDRPDASGLNPAGLGQVLDAVADGEYGAVGAVLVSHRGRLVVEEYYGGHTRERLHPIQSVTKSFLSVLIGIAVEQGHLGLADPLGEVLTSRVTTLDSQANKAAITIRNLLTMRAGFQWDEWACSYLDASCNSNAEMNRSEDWVGFVLGLPMASEPGARFIYNTGASVVLGAALRDATSLDPAEYADEFLFGPLQIESRTWMRNEAHPSRLPHTGGGLGLSARSQAKLGQLVLDRGRWNGRRILSETWLEQSKAAAQPLSIQRSYGLHWWFRRSADPVAAAVGANDWVAWGFGGQHVFVVESLELVVAVQAANPDGSTRGLQLLDALVAGGF